MGAHRRSEVINHWYKLERNCTVFCLLKWIPVQDKGFPCFASTVHIHTLEVTGFDI